MAQQHLVDSITKELKGPMPDTSRAISMMRLAIDYEILDTAKAFEAYRNAIQFASGKNLSFQLGRIYHNQSFLFSTSARYTEALANLDKAIEQYKKSNHVKAKLWEANAYNDLANIYKNQNDFQKAVDFYMKAITETENLGMPDKLVTTYSNISNLFGDMGEKEKQKEYAFKAVEAAKKSGSKISLFTAYFMVAHFYNGQDDSKSAKIYIDSSRKYFDENALINNIDIQFSYFLVSAQVFRKLNQFDSAFTLFYKSYELAKKNNYRYGMAESQLQMGAVLILQKKYAEAEKFLLSGIKDAKAINYLGMLDEGYKYLSDVYAVTGQYKKAYEYFQEYKEANDSVNSLESKKYATELEKKYETEKKQKQIQLQQAQLQRRRILNFVFIGSAGLFLIISVLLYRNYRQKQKLQSSRIAQLEKEKQLTAIDAVLKGEEQERSRLAKDLHDGLGGMMSGIKYSLLTMKKNQIMTPENSLAFDRSMDMLNSSIDEMRRVAHNMMPEALVKFGLDTALNDFCTEVDQSGALQVNYQSFGIHKEMIEQTTAITIYRIVQELINNTMKHASAKSAIVQLSKTNGMISVTVEDDGKGFRTDILQQAKGMGWNNIRSRVDYLNGKMDVRSEAGKGTSVHIELNA